MTTVGIQKVVAFLEKHERTRSWLARRVGVSKTLISLVFNGEMPCSDALAARLSQETGIPVRDFKRKAA